MKPPTPAQCRLQLLRLGAALLAAVLAGTPCAVLAAQPPRVVQGLVTRVTDGDSLWLRPAGARPVEVRLRDIDAPESCQPHGPEARAALSRLVLNKVVTVEISAHDAYGRRLGAVRVGGLDVSRFLVENGHAWSARSRRGQGPLVREEKTARDQARGLHAAPGAMQPKEFRRLHGRCGVPAAGQSRP